GTQVFTGDEIRASGVRSLPEFLMRSAGIYTRDNAGSPNQQIDMRGFGVTGDQNTLILVDGQRISENELLPADLAAIPLTSIERIEIMRGSGAVLYGGGASAGTINVITRGSRIGDREASLMAGYGTYDTGELAAAASLATDQVGATVHLAHYASDNYRDNNELELQNFQSDLRWFGRRGPVYLKINVADQDLRLPGSRTEQQLVTDRRGTATPNDFSTLRTSRVNLGTDLAFGSMRVGVNLTYRERDSFAVNQPGSIDINGNDVTLSPRVRIPFLFGLQHELVTGIDLDKWEYATTSVYPGFSGSLASEQSNTALFLKDTLTVGSATRVTLGARVQRIDTTITDITAGGPAEEQKRDLDAWEIALRQSLTNSIAVYAKTGKSFRVANIDENRSVANPLEPQTSRDSEIGIDYGGLQGWVRATAYHMDIKNELAFLPGDLLPLFGGNVNLPPTLREGVELEAHWFVTRAVSLSGQYSYTVSKYKEGSFGGVDVAGNNIPLVPRHRAGISASVMPLAQLRIIGSINYVGEQYYDNDQSNSFGREMPAYTVTDLSAIYDIGRWTLEGVVRNLFNELYYTYAIRGATTFNAYPSAERSVLVSARYRF
ncbi:MAG: TonB-dependent receptor, partial [Burkholderiales bacterium]|nr:TonB-dependent receptor [Burkholderiales bacterium]